MQVNILTRVSNQQLYSCRLTFEKEVHSTSATIPLHHATDLSKMTIQSQINPSRRFRFSLSIFQVKPANARRLLCTFLFKFGVSPKRTLPDNSHCRCPPNAILSQYLAISLSSMDSTSNLVETDNSGMDSSVISAFFPVRNASVRNISPSVA